MMVERVRTLWLLPLTAVGAVLPGLLLGPGGMDMPFHLPWARFFSELFWQGHPYPRWLPQMYGGCGAPVFYFYPPGAFWLTSLFAFSGQWGQPGWLPLLMTCALVLLCAAYATYRWLREETNHDSALAASLVYLYLPYPTFLLYGMFGFSELLSLALTPALLLSAKHVAEGRDGAIWRYAFFQAALVLCTVPGTIAASPAALFYGLTRRAGAWRKWPVFAAAVLLAAAMSAFYWLPMLALKSEVYVGQDDFMWRDGLDYRNNFMFPYQLFPINAPQFFYALLFYGGCAGFGALLCRHWRECGRIPAYIYVLAAALTVFLSFPASLPIWELMPWMKWMQSPRRLHVLLMLAWVGLLACCVWRDHARRPISSAVVVIMVILIPTQWIMAATYRFNLEGGPASTHYMKISKIFAAYNAVPLQDHLPIHVPLPLLFWNHQPEGLQSLARQCARQAAVVKGQGDAVAVPDGEGMRVKAHVRSPMTLQLGRFYFPAWRVENADHQPVPLRPEAGTGLILLDLEPGMHDLRLYRIVLSEEYLGWGISLLAWLGGIGVNTRYRRRN